MKAKKKKRIILYIVVLLLTLFAIPVLAHSGRTDSKGGHTDSATGEYHYHHGHSAHQHYDIDGDGIIDCPLTYNDDEGSQKAKLGASEIIVIVIGVVYFIGVVVCTKKK